MVELNTREAGEAAGLHSFDTALPLPWYEDVFAKTGLWPQQLGFVWSYDHARIWGEPIPLTIEAIECLRSYHLIELGERIVGHSVFDQAGQLPCRTCAVIKEAEFRIGNS
jgi:hypothetical protein